MQSSTNNNGVQFILDGDAFFAEFLVNLDAVRVAPVAANTYIRLAYWWIDPTCTLAGGGRNTLAQQLQAVATANQRVEIIVWDPADVDALVEPMSRAIKADHAQLKTALDNFNGGKIRVYLEKYDGWNGSSTHQKIAIFSVAGVLTVLVGGLNLADSYYADIPHARTLWHDTAVRITGPAAHEVEKEWLRRWNKGWTALPDLGSIPIPDALTRATGLPIAPGSSLPVRNMQIPLLGGLLKSVVGMVAGTTAGPQALDTTGNAVSVDVRTTNAEGYLYRETDIQDRILNEIRRATHYIYFENYSFFDPSIVRAIHDRLLTIPTLQVIVLLPFPAAADARTYCHYIAFLKIALATCTSVTSSTPGSAPITRAGCSKWAISESYNLSSSARSYTSTFTNGWMENDALVYTLLGSTVEHTLLLTDIATITGGTRFYAPRTSAGDNVYVHSKLALFDDNVAMVGTSNFCFRSMVYDGEISVFIDGNPAVVRGIRHTLFDHYGIPRVAGAPAVGANWDANALPGAAGGAPPVRAHRLQPTDFASRTVDKPAWGPEGRLNFMWL